MSWTNTTVLSVVELIIYIPFVVALLYTLFKHKQPGIFAHVYFFIYIALRIVADAMAIADRNTPLGTSTAGAILNSIGLSPLLLITTGVINEANLYIAGYGSDRGRREKKKVITRELLMHLIVVTGIALLAIGMANTSKGTEQSKTDSNRGLAKAGGILLLLAWAISCLWFLETYRQYRLNKARNNCRILLAAVFLALPFLGARVIYTVVSTHVNSRDLSPAHASFAVRFVLIFLMQLITAVVLLVGLLLARNMHRDVGVSSSRYDHMRKDGSAHELSQDALHSAPGTA